MLQVRGLGFAYPKQNALFTDWSLDIAPGVTWIGGDESTGKTTLLRLLAGDLVPQTGSLSLTNGSTLAAQSAAYQSQVAWVDPRTQAFDAITPNTFWSTLQSQYPAWDAALLAELIDGLALGPHVGKALYMLSTGTKRKVYLAGALASSAAVTLLDEPFAALDKTSIELLLELLKEAATHPSRAWVVADYVAPRGVRLAAQIQLGP